MFGVQSMWFLPVYFCAMLNFDFGISRVDKRLIRTLLVVRIIAISIIVDSNVIEMDMLTRLFGIIMATLSFVIADSLLKPALLKMKHRIALIVMICTSVPTVVNGFVSVNYEYGNNPVLFFSMQLSCQHVFAIFS
jgi:hypothetical protein